MHTSAECAGVPVPSQGAKGPKEWGYVRMLARASAWRHCHADLVRALHVDYEPLAAFKRDAVTMLTAGSRHRLCFPDTVQSRRRASTQAHCQPGLIVAIG